MISRVKTAYGHEEITAYSVAECRDYLPKLKFNKKRRNRRTYLYATDYMTLDTETSHAGERCGWVYQWAVKLRDVYIYGRKPSELVDLLQILREAYELMADKSILVYIHNSSYDVQYLKHYLDVLSLMLYSILQE